MSNCFSLYRYQKFTSHMTSHKYLQCLGRTHAVFFRGFFYGECTDATIMTNINIKKLKERAYNTGRYKTLEEIS